MATDLEVGAIPITFNTLGGGLNTTSGPLQVDNSESTSLQNIDFNTFGSILKRTGYTTLGTACAATGTAQGLYWYTGLFDRATIMVNHGKIYKMDNLDGTWDDITGVIDLTAGATDTYTKLLLHCDGTNGSTSFTDFSQFNHTIVANGDAAVSTTRKKFGTGSLLCGSTGTGDYLSSVDSADWNLSGVGGSDFTVDFWLEFVDVVSPPIQYLVSTYKVADGDGWIFGYDYNGGTKRLFVWDSVLGYSYLAWAPINDTWYHVALVRNSGTLTCYINGTSIGNFADRDFNNNSNPLTIGCRDDGAAATAYNGRLDEIRISKDIARWTGNFTSPIAPYGDYPPQDFDTFLGYVLGADTYSAPWQWYYGNSTASSMTVVSGLTTSKFVKKFQNYCILANVKVSGIRYPSRFYWSNFQTINSWSSVAWIEVSKDDGNEITSLKVLGDRLVIYKSNSIYVVMFTGSADVPFIVQKANSSVGCVAPFSIQEVNNGHIFVAQDGIYFFDGYNSYKMSDRINDTFQGINLSRLAHSSSMYQRIKNQYYLSVASGTSLYNNFVLTWNAYLNSWSVYTGWSASSMAIFMVDGSSERPYFADYLGYAYRADYGQDDYPSNTLTAIDCQYYTNWKHYDDICDSKGIPHIYLVHKNESYTDLTLNYSYDFYNGNQYSSTFSLFTTQTVTALTTRRDLTGRGRFVRIGFTNNETTTSFRIDGLGTYVTKESKS